ncbi:MAG: phosphatidate cytidylyltransferase [Micromonosporaceae bacterium]
MESRGDYGPPPVDSRDYPARRAGAGDVGYPPGDGRPPSAPPGRQGPSGWAPSGRQASPDRPVGGQAGGMRQPPGQEDPRGGRPRPGAEPWQGADQYGVAPGRPPAPGETRSGGAPSAPGAGRPGEARSGAGRSRDSGKTKKAGRNLPMAIGVGLTLGGLVIASLYVWRPAFVVLAAVAILVGIWEMVRAVEPAGARPPLVPLLIGGAAIVVLAWFAGIEAMVLGLVLTVVAVLIWRLGDGPVGYQRDVISATLIAAYVPFLAGFAVLLAKPEDGAFRVTIMIAAVVLSDTGGFVAGSLLGQHRMAPSVSPNKSWEGFGGSVLASAVGSALMVQFMLHQPWWEGALFGVAIAFAGTLGDLSESLMKRDLGVKDMGRLLPGHGGLMDRLDSLLLAAPTGYVLLLLFAPSTG